MAVPPIITHLSRVLPPVLMIASILYAGLWLLQRKSSIALQIPTWFAFVVCLSALPASTILQAFFNERKYNRDAARKGAMLVPMLPLTGW